MLQHKREEKQAGGEARLLLCHGDASSTVR
jgi:hypothetical protein